MGVWNKLRNLGGAKQNLTVDAAEVPAGGAPVEGKKEVAKAEEVIEKKKGAVAALKKAAGQEQKIVAASNGDQEHNVVTVPDDKKDLSAISNVDDTVSSLEEESNFIRDLTVPQKKALQDFKEKIEALIRVNGFAIPPNVKLAPKAAAEAEAIEAAEETSPPTTKDATSAGNDAPAVAVESAEVLDGAGTAVPAESGTKEVEAVVAAGAPVVETLVEMTTPAPEVEALVETTPASEVEALVEATPVPEVETPVETAAAPEVEAPMETAAAPEVEIAVETTPAPKAEVPVVVTSAPEDEATADVGMPAVETKEPLSETKIAELEETTKEVATETLLEQSKDNILPLEESKENPEDVCLWGVPLSETKRDERTNVILLKFLRAREFKVDDACTMLVNTIRWRQSFRAASLLKELESKLNKCFYMQGNDKEGHPVCYNVWGAFQDIDLFQKMLADASKMQQSFVKWRVQLLEKGIRQLDFTPAGTSAILQVNDLKSIPLFKKEMRGAINEVISLLEDNYPELVVKNVFLNPPWYFSALYNFISPFITQRMKSKIILARPGQIFRSIAPENVPVQYGGFAQPNDVAFTGAESSVQELCIKAGEKEPIEIPMEQAESTAVWDLSVIGWDVSYGAEFAPTATESYHTIVEKTKKFLSSEQLIRRTFRCKEPGKLVLSINNTASKKKKLVFYRFKVEVPGAVAEL